FMSSPPLFSSSSFPPSLHHPHPLSFPTRRSSDLPIIKAARTNTVITKYIILLFVCFFSTFIKLSAAPLDSLVSFYCILQAGSLLDRKSTRLNSSHVSISYAVFCLKKNIY